MKIIYIIVVSFMSLGLISSLLGGVIYFNTSLDIIEEEIGDSLLAISKSRVKHIETYLNQLKESIELLATHSELTNQELKNAHNIKEEFFAIFILDSNGEVSQTTNNEIPIGHNFSDEQFFLNGKKETFVKSVYYDRHIGGYAILISAPFHEGVLVAKINLDIFHKIISDRTGLRDTGEVLIAFEDKGDIIFIFDRLFEKDTKSKLFNESTEPMRQALFGNELIFENILDYRDEPVVAVSQYIKEIDVGLVAKIDREEFFGFRKQILLVNSIIIGGIIILITSLFGVLVSRRISQPLTKLRKGAKLIDEGGLKHKIDVKSKDEIEEIASSFNVISGNLKKSRKDLEKVNKELEKKVKDRTKKLEKNISELQTFKDMVMDRELKMIELKKVIKELKSKK